MTQEFVLRSEDFLNKDIEVMFLFLIPGRIFWLALLPGRHLVALFGINRICKNKNGGNVK